MVWAWNRLHEELQMLFAYSVTRANPEAGIAIWHAIPSDGARREALRAATGKLESPPKAVRDGILWLLHTVEKLAPHRNDAVHTPVKLNWTERAYVVPTNFAHSRHANRMTAANKGLKEFHRNLRDDLHVLIRFGGALTTGILEPAKYEYFVSPAIKSLPSNLKPPKTKKKPR